MVGTSNAAGVECCRRCWIRWRWMPVGIFVDSISYAESSPESVLEDGGSPMWSETDEKLAIDLHPDGLEMEGELMDWFTYLTQSKRRSAGRLVSLWIPQYRCSLPVACF